MKKILSLTVKNHAGVISRISSLFSGKGYSLESLVGGTTPELGTSDLTLVCETDNNEFDQIKKQLNKLIDVIKVKDLSKGEIAQKELAYIRIDADHKDKQKIISITNAYDGAQVTDISYESVIIEIAADSEKINNFLTLFPECKNIEIARTGLVAVQLPRK
ncbi:MAG: acetolactate synthase small subunit [bacterium]|nr:acetolactate synthase small subunit [bacterium]